MLSIFYIAYYIRPFITYSHFFFLLYILNFLGWTQYRSKNAIKKIPYNTTIPVIRYVCRYVYIYRLLIISISLLTQIITPVFHLVHLHNLIVYWNKCVYESMLCLIMVYVFNPLIGLLQSRKLWNSIILRTHPAHQQYYSPSIAELTVLESIYFIVACAGYIYIETVFLTWIIAGILNFFTDL